MIHIVIDTNFIYRKLLSEPLEMVPLLGIAKQIGAKVWIPVGVIEEWKSSLELRAQDLLRKVSSVNLELKQLGMGALSQKIDKDTVSTTMEAANIAFMAEHDIEELPHPTTVPSASELFSLAVAKAPPFDAKGNSFRDAMIVLAIEEFAKSHAADEIFVLSSDGPLKQDCRVRAGNVKILSPPQVRDELEKHLSGAMKEKLHALEVAVLDFVKSRKISEVNVALKDAEFRDRDTLSREVVKIEGFELKSINHAALTDLPSKGSEGLPLLVSVSGSLRFLEKATLLGPLSMMVRKKITKVGEVREENPWGELGDNLHLNVPVRTDEECVIYIYGTANFIDGKLVDVIFNFAKERERSLATLGSLAMSSS